MPDHLIPLRWADLDALDHVNNVVYLDYAAQARAVMVDEGQLDDRPTRRVTVRFIRPLLLGPRPVLVTSVLDGDALTQEICVGADGTAQAGRTVFARVTSVLGESDQGPAQLEAAPSAPIWVRRSDVGPGGFVTSTKLFELLQESRIAYFSVRMQERSVGRYVVGTVDLELGEPVPWRTTPLVTRSRITRVGNGSFTVVTEITDGAVVHARGAATLVGFDLPTQSSRPFSEDEKAMLSAAD